MSFLLNQSLPTNEPTVLEKPVEARFKDNKSERREKILRIVGIILINAVLVVLSFLVLFPFIYMIFSSFKTNEAFAESLSNFWPSSFNFDGYQVLFSRDEILKGYLNSFIIILCVIPCGTFFAAMAAFGFSKLKLRKKTFWLLFLLSGMMVPGAVLLMPRYMAYQQLGWVGTMLPLIVPHLLMNVGMMFFFIQYMQGIPKELFEAAKIDGSHTFGMYLRIMLPMLLPAIAAQDIFWFMGIWNEYFGASIYMPDVKNTTLQVILANLNSSASGNNYQLLFSGAVVSCIPMVIVYLILQKFFIKSMSIGAVKG